MTEVARAMSVVTAAIRDDEGYRQSWQANIAMFVWDAIQRAGFEDADRKLHAACNEGATEFLKVLCMVTPTAKEQADGEG
jgi:hypothetical protein